MADMIKLLNCFTQLLKIKSALFGNDGRGVNEVCVGPASVRRRAGLEDQAIRNDDRACAGVTDTGIDFEVGVPVPSPKLVSGTSGLVSG